MRTLASSGLSLVIVAALSGGGAAPAPGPARTPQALAHARAHRGWAYADDLQLAGTRTYWPTAAWQAAPGMQEITDGNLVYRGNPARLDTPACHAFTQYSLDSRGDERAQKGVRTDGMAVIKHGQLEFEYYRPPFTANSPHCLWSASKSVTAALVAASIQRYRTSGDERLHISLDDKLASYFPESERPAAALNDNEHFYGDITLADLLTMGAGFDWNESYEAGLLHSSVTRMIYTEGYTDMAAYAAHYPLRAEGPGQKWIYSSGNSTLVMGILKKIYGADYDRMPWTNLFDVIGMQHVAFEQDGAGTFVGSSYVHATPLDMAKLGYLFLNDGMWGTQAADGSWQLERVLPEGWVDWTRQIVPAYASDQTKIANTTEEGVFGASWWLNVPAKGLPAPYPSVPEDMYAAMGHYGQYVFVIPSLDLVITRTGDDRDFSTDVDKMVKTAIDCFSDSNTGAGGGT